MSRRQQLVYPHLDAKDVKSLPMAEVRTILRAADGLIAVGGRSLLSKVLKGSRAKDVISHGLDQNPAYGSFKELAAEEVLALIDWTILHGYLRIEFSGRLPVLTYTHAGWEIERETFAIEIIRGFDTLLASSQRPYPVNFLKDRNREMILLVLEKIQASGDRKYLPVLEDWSLVDHKKVKARIGEVMRSLLDRAA
jgi:superfamily II DNA helicase RecQ